MGRGLSFGGMVGWVGGGSKFEKGVVVKEVGVLRVLERRGIGVGGVWGGRWEGREVAGKVGG